MTNEVQQGGDQLRPYIPNKIVAGYIPLADFLAKSLGNRYEYFLQNQDKNFIANYCNRTPAGKVLASSTYFIKDDHQKLIGCICLNCDTSLYLELRDMLNQFLEQTLSGLDLSSMRAEDKKDVIRQLNRRGIFLLKGTVEEVAHRLDISTQTLYRYLKDLS